MDNRSVTHNHPVAYRALLVGRRMNHDAFLYHRFIANVDSAIVAPEDRPVADVTVVTYSDVPDHLGRFTHVSVVADRRRSSVKTVKHDCLQYRRGRDDAKKPHLS